MPAPPNPVVLPGVGHVVRLLIGAASLAATSSLLTVVHVTPAAGGVELCHGQPATIVGDGSAIVGTQGPDVIATNGSREVRAGAGDDLICVTGPLPVNVGVSIRANGGDDEVEVFTYGVNTFVRLGEGDDQYVGATGNDVVLAGDVGRDVITTGTGNDAPRCRRDRHGRRQRPDPCGSCGRRRHHPRGRRRA
jgi:Ca2+-binding RTX toxin-like protein